jgi:predicted SprT family Zn-dependent metalloprotease
MKRADILSLARKEMNKHGLIHWTVKFIRSKSVAGLCWTTRWHEVPELSSGRIELSLDYFEVFSDYDILDTIRHEIAHALTKTVVTRTSTGKVRRVSHGADWKATAKRIGCSGMRCVRAEAERPKGRYKGICPNGHEITRHRLTWSAKHNSSCPRCCKTFSREHMFDWYDNGKLIHSQAKHESVWAKQAEEITKILQKVN